MKRFYRSLLVLFALCIGCAELPDAREQCIKGKFIDTQCSGYVIQVLDNQKIGKDWKGMLSDKGYKNCLLAHFDSTEFKKTVYKDPLNLKADSVFYFKFREGSYPRATFNICEQEPFVTITYTSASHCL